MISIEKPSGPVRPSDDDYKITATAGWVRCTPRLVVWPKAPPLNHLAYSIIDRLGSQSPWAFAVGVPEDFLRLARQSDEGRFGIVIGDAMDDLHPKFGRAEHSATVIGRDANEAGDEVAIEHGEFVA